MARLKKKLTTGILPADHPADVPLLLIEGDRQALILLGRLLIAQALTGDDGIQLAPKSAGSSLFTRSSTIGIYIHRLTRSGRGSRAR